MIAPAPFAFLSRHAALIPRGAGKALDVAPGNGGNLFYLSRIGFSVDAIEPDKEKAKALAIKARTAGARVKIIIGDPSRIQFARGRYDLILCFYHVQPSAILQIKHGLRAGGFVLMESYTQKQLDFSDVPKSILLKPKELLFFFKGYKIIQYEERLEKGPKAVASIIAQKPDSS